MEFRLFIDRLKRTEFRFVQMALIFDYEKDEVIRVKSSF